MDVGLLESMAQDESPKQEMLNEQEQFPPQTNPEPEMGAAAAAVYDTSPPPLRQNLPIPAETAHPSAPDMAQLFAMLAEMNRGINNKMDDMNQNLIGNTQMLREEMQCMGAGLQDGLNEVEEGQNQLKGEMEKNTRAVEQLKEEQGEVLRETCWARVVTEKVTERVTQREKLIGVTETCTREIRHEVKGIKKERKEQLKQKTRLR